MSVYGERGIARRWSLMAVLAFASMGLAGCTPDSPEAAPPSASPEPDFAASSEPPLTALPMRTEFSIALPRGSRRASTSFDALDPLTHSQSIAFEIRPAGAQVQVDFHTADGALLHVLRGTSRGDCDRRQGVTKCKVELPILEARQPGRWRAVARRLDAPVSAATVDARLQWHERK